MVSGLLGIERSPHDVTVIPSGPLPPSVLIPASLPRLPVSGCPTLCSPITCLPTNAISLSAAPNPRLPSGDSNRDGELTSMMRFAWLTDSGMLDGG
ncbi:hypothetical protein BDR06DRAFT_535695 [Suillus hirtellus]|nr:hypothetical protein BDR06DRAFT_535695 [Suillus hirtellus]